MRRHVPRSGGGQQSGDQLALTLGGTAGGVDDGVDSIQGLGQPGPADVIDGGPLGGGGAGRRLPATCDPRGVSGGA